MRELTLPIDYETGYASWNRTLMAFLAGSGEFSSVKQEALPRLDRQKAGRWGGCFSPIKIDGVLCAIDTWDTSDPTSSAFRGGDPLMQIVKHVFKIQWQPEPVWNEMFRAGILVRPWTIFPSREFPLGCFHYEAKQEHQWIGAFTGARRHGRGSFYDAADESESRFYKLAPGEKTDLDSYLRVLKSCKWGISLGGKRGTDRKNRREIEFASCGMPLALNYKPHYPFPFEAGVHYFHLDSAEDIERLTLIDPEPYAIKAWHVYQHYWKPKSAAQLLLKMVDDPTLGLDF